MIGRSETQENSNDNNNNNNNNSGSSPQVSTKQQIRQLFSLNWNLLPPDIPPEFEGTLQKVSDTQFNTFGTEQGVDLYSQVDWKEKLMNDPHCNNFLIINRGNWKLAKLTCTFEFFCALDHVILLLQLFNHKSEHETVQKLSKEIQLIEEKLKQQPSLLQGGNRLFIIDNRCGANSIYKSSWTLLGKQDAKWEDVDFHTGTKFSWMEKIPFLK